MTDETQTDTQPTPDEPVTTDAQKPAADPSPDTTGSQPQGSESTDTTGSDKTRRQIKIGSQKPGWVDETKKKRKETIVPVVPKPVHREQPREKFVTSADATQVASYGSDEEGSNTPTSPADMKSIAEAAAKTATQASAATQAGDSNDKPAADGANETPQDEVSKVSLDDIDLDMSDEDLEKEIAAAMGENVDGLLAGQVAGKSQEIEFDERYQATVLRIYRESVIFELPEQNNGAAPLKQFDDVPEPGAVLEVMAVGFNKAEQMYDLVVPGASVQVADWSDVQEGVVVEAKVTGHNKGGLECEINNIKGFIPASQISLYRIEDFSTMVEQTLQCVVTEANPERRNLVLSRRAVLEREREEEKEKLLAELAVGQTREGTVTRIQPFGAFVDLGGVDGLIHISQLSWDNIRHPSEVVKEGQQVRVRIERMDPETGKIGLSYKDLSHHPWEGIEGKYPQGNVVTGTVSKIMDFGAFVKLEAGVEGLVHISELSHKRVNRVSHVVEEGQRVEVKILTVDPDSQRISLSMKQAAGAPADGEAAQEDGEPIVKHDPKVPIKSLKGGKEGKSGGEQFGLKW